MALDFDSYLDVPVEDIDRPKPPPVGHYYATIKTIKGREVDYGQGGPKEAVMTVTFSLNDIADDDIDPNDLPEGGVKGQIATRDYSLTDPQGKFALRQLGEVACGLDVKGLKLGDMLEACKGQEVKLAISHRPDKNNPEVVYTKVDRVLAVD